MEVDAAVEEQEPTTEVPAPETESPPESTDVNAPWLKDVQSAFEDASVQQQVLDYMSSKYQPYVTKIEEERALLAKKAELYDAYQEDPTGVYLDMTKHIFGEEPADAVTQAILEALGEDDLDDSDDSEVSDAPWRNDPEVVAAMEYAAKAREEEERQLQRESYAQLLNDIREANPGLTVDEDILVPFILATEGDADKAVAAYNAWIDKAEAMFTGDSESLTPDDVPNPPPTLGGTATSEPPTLKEYSSFDEAFEDFFAEQKSAPPVLSV